MLRRGSTISVRPHNAHDSQLRAAAVTAAHRGLMQRRVGSQRAARPDREVGLGVLAVQRPPAQHRGHAVHERRRVRRVRHNIVELGRVGGQIEEQRRETLRAKVNLANGRPAVYMMSVASSCTERRRSSQLSETMA